MVEKSKDNKKGIDATQPVNLEKTESTSRLSEYLTSKSKQKETTTTTSTTNTKTEELQKSRFRTRLAALGSGAMTAYFLASAAVYAPEVSQAISIYRAVNLTASAARTYLQSTGALAGTEAFAISMVGAVVTGGILAYSIWKDRQLGKKIKEQTK